VKQGSKAAYTGKNLEDFVRNTLLRHGYRKVRKDLFPSMIGGGSNIFTEHFSVGQNIYGNDTVVDFILYHPKKHPDCLIIEVKWQQVGGTVEQKYPFLVLNIKECYKMNTIIILDGGGYTKGAETWLRNQVGGNLKGVFNMSEFQKWANDGNI